MSLHTWHCQGLHKPSSCATFMLNSHWGRAARGNKTSCVYALRVPSALSYSLWHCRLWPARLLCQEGSSPGKNTGAYWPILVARLFWSTTFPAALATNSFEYLVLPEPLRPEQLQHIHPWPSQGHRGSVAKEEDPSAIQVQIKSTRSTRQTLCLWNMQKVIESSHKRKCTSSDSCGHWRQEHIGVGPD